MNNQENKPTLTLSALSALCAEDIDISFYDAICDIYSADNKYKDLNLTRDQIVSNEIDSFLSDYVLQDYKEAMDLRAYLLDQRLDDIRYGDSISEYADSSAAIYDYALWRHAPILSDWIEDAITEYGNSEAVIKERGVIGLFTQGEYLFYEHLAYEILGALEKWQDEESTK